MAEKALLEAFSILAADEVRYFTLADVIYISKKKRLCLLLGYQGIYLLRRKFTSLIANGRVLYKHIYRVIEDLNNRTDLLLTLTEERPREWAEASLRLRCMERMTFLRMLQTMWATSDLLRNEKFQQFPWFEQPLPRLEDELENDFPRVNPFQKTIEFQYKSYFFFLNEGFSSWPPSFSSANSGTFMDKRGMEFFFIIRPSLPMACAEMIGKDKVRAAAFEFKKILLENVKQSSLVISQPYIKKMNLADDPASWLCWELRIRTDKHSIICVNCRRSFIPPLMDTYQDIAIIARQSYDSARASKTDDFSFIKEVHFVVDTVSPCDLTNVWYPELIQLSADALLLDYSALHWIRQNLKITPIWLPAAQRFLRSILRLMKEEGFLPDSGILEELGKGEETHSEPMLIVKEMILHNKVFGLKTKFKEQEEDEGFGKVSAAERFLKMKNRWIMRLAEYLLWCIDGGLLGKQFTLKHLCDATASVGMKTQRKFQDILTFILHIRPADMTKEWIPVKISEYLYENLQISSAEKANSEHEAGRMKEAENSMKNYIFNEKALLAFLECQYVSSLFLRGEEKLYLSLLGFFIVKSQTIKFKTSLCKYIFTLSSDIVYNTIPELPESIVPPLITLLKSKSSSTVLVSIVLGCLINLCALNNEAKKHMMDSGIASICVNLLRLNIDDFLENTLILVFNLTKEESHQKKFLSAGIILVLVDIFLTSYENPYSEAASFHGIIAATIGQISTQKWIAHTFCFKYPVLDCLLDLFQNLEAGSDSKLKVIYALKQLSTHDWRINQRIAKHCCPRLIMECASCNDLLFSSEYVSVLMLLLQNLSIYLPNCEDMLSLGVEEGIYAILNGPHGCYFEDEIEKLQKAIRKFISFKESFG